MVLGVCFGRGRSILYAATVQPGPIPTLGKKAGLPPLLREELKALLVFFGGTSS
jgi:hypothetical protein